MPTQSFVEMFDPKQDLKKFNDSHEFSEILGQAQIPFDGSVNFDEDSFSILPPAKGPRPEPKSQPEQVESAQPETEQTDGAEDAGQKEIETEEAKVEVVQSESGAKEPAILDARRKNLDAVDLAANAGVKPDEVKQSEREFALNGKEQAGKGGREGAAVERAKSGREGEPGSVQALAGFDAKVEELKELADTQEQKSDESRSTKEDKEDSEETGEKETKTEKKMKNKNTDTEKKEEANKFPATEEVEPAKKQKKPVEKSATEKNKKGKTQAKKENSEPPKTQKFSRSFGVYKGLGTSTQSLKPANAASTGAPGMKEIMNKLVSILKVINATVHQKIVKFRFPRSVPFFRHKMLIRRMLTGLKKTMEATFNILNQKSTLARIQRAIERNLRSCRGLFNQYFCGAHRPKLVNKSILNYVKTTFMQQWRTHNKAFQPKRRVNRRNRVRPQMTGSDAHFLNQSLRQINMTVKIRLKPALGGGDGSIADFDKTQSIEDFGQALLQLADLDLSSDAGRI